MIPLSAPSISANAAKSNGTAPSASPNGAESAGFAALLGAAGSTPEAPEAGAKDMAAAMTEALAGLSDGKSGKAGGKMLPVEAIADLAGSDDPETTKTPDEATSDQADVPIAAAIPVLPLIVPPLPGADSSVEFRAAGPDSPSTRTTVRIDAAIAAPPRVASQAAKSAQMETAVPATLQAAANGIAPAQILQLKLAPVVTADAQPPVEGRASETSTSNVVAQIITAQAAATARPTAAVAAVVSPAATEAAQPAPPAKAAPVSAVASQAAVSPQARAIAVTDVAGTRADPKSPMQVASAPASLANSGKELNRGESGIQTAAQPMTHFPTSHPAPAVPAADIATVASTAPAAAERPHDFATLVDRLSEAREAASPQVVRTALQHAEFGRVSLQFRQDDANLSVTMANADPAFTSAVHSAVTASLAGSAAGNGDQPNSDRQPSPQQQQTSAQQQSAATGSGHGQGQQQAAQARSGQDERNLHRAQGSSDRAQQGEATSPDRAETGARRSGIYA